MEVPDGYEGKAIKCTSCGASIKADPIAPTSPQKAIAKPQPKQVEDKPWVKKIKPMSSGQGFIIIVLLILASGFTLFEKIKPVEQWEYLIESPSDLMFNYTMDRLGKEGWELVTARRATGGYDDAQYECIFKRPVRIFNQPPE